MFENEAIFHIPTYLLHTNYDKNSNPYSIHDVSWYFECLIKVLICTKHTLFYNIHAIIVYFKSIYRI